MILIADSGATKTHWVLIDRKRVKAEFYTSGFNPYYYGGENFVQSLKDSLNDRDLAGKVDMIYFYAAGCSSEANVKIVERLLGGVFENAGIVARHDLYGAAIALLGNTKGIACILGTGSNSCLWDGNNIIANVPSVGYLLGDEGGGTYSGMLLTREVLLGIADKEIAQLFYESVNMNFSAVLDKIYKEPNPNRFFSQQTKFLRQNIDNKYCREVMRRSFSDFVNVQLLNYPGVRSLPVSFTGSVAANFQDILVEVLNSKGISMGRIIKEPMEGLVEYHNS